MIEGVSLDQPDDQEKGFIPQPTYNSAGFSSIKYINFRCDLWITYYNMKGDKTTTYSKGNK